MTSTALHQTSQHEVERASKHSGLRRWATTWGRAVIIALAFAVQLLVLIAVLTFPADWSSAILAVQSVLAVVVMLFILNGRRETTYKLAWIIPVLTTPLLGSVFYLFYGATVMTRSQRERFDAATQRARDALRLVPPTHLSPDEVSSPVRRQLTYLESISQYRVFDDTATTYYPLGELGFDAMIEAISRARHYVFAEFFIVDGGKMLDRLVDALAARAAEGVDVRFLYDDLGSFFTLPVGLRQRCEAAGIAVIPVNPVGLGFTLTFQNRDHRKILSVDGLVAFTGGINIADEYINEIVRFGHWKDTVLRLEGPGAWGLTVMFLQMWELASRARVEYASFLPSTLQALEAPSAPEDTQRLPAPLATDARGHVAPFDDTPFDELSLGSDIYQHLMQAAKHSVDIFTPYLVLNDSMVAQLAATARSGIRVRIVVPGIPDKWYVSLATHSHYRPLMEAGIEVYEYTPG
ncbi:MAG: phospholipase D-like domain-containing protein, partial [Arachnia sp.]